MHFSQKIANCHGNMKETWKTINKRSKTTRISSLAVDDTSLTINNEIADAMNDSFCSIGEKLSSNIPSIENPFLNGDYSINDNCVRSFISR